MGSMTLYNCLEIMHFWCSVLLILLAAVSVCVHSQQPNTDGFINIDCGLGKNVTSVNKITGLTYVSDDQYIDTGENSRISSQLTENYTDLETLRSFPTNKKSCYTLIPVTKGSKYLVRAIFYYGNYDRLNKFPKFDLYFGVNFWSTVDIKTSTDPYAYAYEIIAIAPANYAQVCLVNTGYGTPFISVLELRPLNDTLYPLANSTQSLNKIRRRDIGSPDGYYTRYPQDAHDRQWEGWKDSWTAISTDFSIPSKDFDVPSSVLQTAAVMATVNSSLDVSWTETNKWTIYFLVLHFAELQVLQNSSVRQLAIYANGAQILDPITPKYLSHSYSSFTLTGYTSYIVSLKCTPNATLPLIVNAWERYTLVPVIWLPSYYGDVDAINTIKTRYNVSKDGSGDPCVPTGLGWTWVNCTIDSLNISRITTLNLSFQGLTNEMVPAFGYLTALEKLDLSHNNLSGSIPTSLDNLVSLTFLDLSENSYLSGTLPPGLQKRSNNGLHVNLNGTGVGLKETKRSSKAVIIVVVVVVTVFLIVGAATLFFFYRQKHKKISNYSHAIVDNGISSSAFHDQADIVELNFDKKQFSFEELRLITNEFRDELGIGGFGKVFKGQLETGMEVAVKVRTETSSQGIREFLNEVQMLSRIHHKNLVSLIGYCKDSNNIALVYEYLQEGNLQECIRGKVRSVPWKQRLQIAFESAQGLEYLHKMCNPPLIHRDVKASNILLTTNLEAKISDFGLVRAFTGTHVSTQVVGTPGYLDPYYASTFQLTEKSDVYSFGVVLLEIITGLSPILQAPQSGQHLTQFVQQRLSKGNIESILDPNMGVQYNLNSIWKVADLALRCTDHPAKRPDMPIIVMELKESLNLEMSNMELTSMVPEDISQYSGYSINDSHVSGNSEIVHTGDMRIFDDLSMLR